MRIVLVSDCYLPRLGGIEVQVHDLAHGLASRGHDVHVLAATRRDGVARGVEDTHPDGPADAPWTVHRLTSRVLGDTPVSPFAAPRLRALLADADVVHAHCGVVSPFAHLAVPIALELGRPTLVTFHSMLGPAEPLFRFQGRFRRWARRGAVFSAVSDAAAEPLRRILAAADAPADVAILPNGIGPSGWTPPALPGRRDRDPGEPVRLVAAMRLATRKRPMALLRAVRRTREALPASRGLTLDVLGAGPQERRVRAYLARHGMSEWVRLPGRVDRAELARRYHAADVYVSPARLESFGIAPLEARTAGLAVVAMRSSGSRDYITDGVNGLLVDDDAELATALTRLALDDDLRESIKATNAAGPPDEVWDAVIDLTERAYLRISGGRPPTAPVRLVAVPEGEGAAPVLTARLAHGRHPAVQLRAAGWEVVGLPEVSGPGGREQRIDLTYRVRPAAGAPTGDPAPRVEDVARPDERTERVTRLAGYAVVTAQVEGRECLLLTTASTTTGRPGDWLLPGGGLDVGEAVADGVAREVFEETGQVIAPGDLELLEVSTDHWVGRSPAGRLEDYHPVRLIHRGRVDEPGAAVVHDVGGSTGEAWWHPVADLAEGRDLMPVWTRDTLTALGLLDPAG